MTLQIELLDNDVRILVCCFRIALLIKDDIHILSKLIKINLLINCLWIAHVDGSFEPIGWHQHLAVVFIVYLQPVCDPLFHQQISMVLVELRVHFRIHFCYFKWLLTLLMAHILTLLLVEHVRFGGVKLPLLVC